MSKAQPFTLAGCSVAGLCKQRGDFRNAPSGFITAVMKTSRPTTEISPLASQEPHRETKQLPFAMTAVASGMRGTITICTTS